MERRAPIPRSRVPIKRKRPGPPRRGRVVNEAFMDMVREGGCILAKIPAHHCEGIITFHHVREFGSPKNDEHGLGLCVRGHLQGASLFSIESLGKKGFQAYWGVDIEAEIAANVAAWEAMK